MLLHQLRTHIIMANEMYLLIYTSLRCFRKVELTHVYIYI